MRFSTLHTGTKSGFSDFLYVSSNHLGNVLTVVSDKKIAVPGGSVISNMEMYDFQTGGVPSNIYSGGNPINANVVLQKLKIIPDLNNNMDILAVSFNSNLTVGQQYQLSLDVDPSLFAGDYSIEGYNGQPLFSDYYMTPSAPSGKYTYNFTALATHVEFQIIITSNTYGSSITFDNISLSSVSPPSNSVANYFTPDIISSTDYYAFGAPMPGRQFNSSSYKYGFNGKENDAETGTQDYGMRIYNPALGKFLSVDPITSQYPELTPYQFASNRPICAIDRDGLEAADVGANIENLIIVVQGYPAGKGNPPNGKTQSANAGTVKPDLGRDDKLGRINESYFPVNTQVVNFASSNEDGDGQTVPDITKTIKDYQALNPNGKVILVGHSGGAMNLLNVIGDKDIKVDLLVTIDPSAAQRGGASLATSKTVGINVKNYINYRNNVDDISSGLGISGGRPDWKEKVNGAVITLDNLGHGTIDDKIYPYVIGDIYGAIIGIDAVQQAKNRSLPNKNKEKSTQ